MKVTVNESDGTVYVALVDAEPERDFPTNIWRKFGVRPHWDGRGGLIGIEFTGATNIEVRQESEGTQ